MVLFVNACVRKDSRTKRVADRLLNTLNQPVTELRLADCLFPAVDEAFLNMRDRLIEEEDFGDPMFALARQFAQADDIVVAAPYWDLSFPAVLKQYIEQINVSGVTFRYSEEGIPEGLCKANRLFYITTAGGDFVPDDYGYGYIKALAENFYGINTVELIKAAGLDIVGADVEQILSSCEEESARRRSTTHHLG